MEKDLADGPARSRSAERDLADFPARSRSAERDLADSPARSENTKDAIHGFTTTEATKNASST